MDLPGDVRICKKNASENTRAMISYLSAFNIISRKFVTVERYSQGHEFGIFGSKGLGIML
jgi:hypothetical protein